MILGKLMRLKHDFGDFWETLWELKCKYARFMDQDANMRKYGSKCEHKKYEWHVNMQNIGNMMAFY